MQQTELISASKGCQYRQTGVRDGPPFCLLSAVAVLRCDEDEEVQIDHIAFIAYKPGKLPERILPNASCPIFQ
jgi:hypothetical protein